MTLERRCKIELLEEIDGCNHLCFIVYALADHDLVVCKFSDTNESHSLLAEYAAEEEIVTEESEPVAGGIFDVKTGMYERPSLFYGEADANLQEYIGRWLAKHACLE
jgi:hypothetical protein